MEKPIIDFGEFDLHFLTESDEGEENDYGLDNDEIKENMISLIPEQAIFLGTFDSEVENWTSWTINDDYYIIPLVNDDFDWALFRITWDDNWGRWELSFDARLKDFNDNHKEASRFIIKKLWTKWNIDLKARENKPWVKFLKEI
jgi:hypothetical protein